MIQKIVQKIVQRSIGPVHILPHAVTKGRIFFCTLALCCKADFQSVILSATKLEYNVYHRCLCYFLN